MGQLIALKKAPKTIKADQQKKKITGTVTDTEGEPLPGVTVMVAGSTRGVITDPDGKYEISVIATDKLQFSFIGMTTQEIDVNGKTTINVILQDKSEELDDVTVVAFGKQKKESVLASVTTVKPGELKMPTSNLTTALAGKMSGVISYQRSGEPGQDNAEFFVRGVTTFGYKKDPLILIDGIELSSADLARLNPDDVESFSIMKDATATALYGARGANGVILVTTKSGTEGKAKFSFRFENSISSPTKDIELADPITFMKMHNESVLTRDPLAEAPYSASRVYMTEKGENPIAFPQVDWKEMLIKDKAINQRFNFNVSGGGKVSQYYIAGSFTQDNGILKNAGNSSFNSNIDLKKYLLRSNININVTKTTKAAVRFHGTFDDYRGPMQGGGEVYRSVLAANPVLFPAYYPATDDTKFVEHIRFGNYDKGGYLNPYAEMVRGYKDYSKTLMLVQMELTQDLSFITKGLRARFLGSTNRYSEFSVTRSYNPFYYTVGLYDYGTKNFTLANINQDAGTDYLSYTEGGKKVNTSYYGEFRLNYDQTFNEDHGVSGMLVATMREYKSANAGSLQSSLEQRNLGLSGRFTYNYKSRYFSEFNFGYNGSERFDSDHRFGFFPSAGAAWLVSNEPFFENLKKKVNKLKAKFTYGLVGNDAIGDPNDRFFYISKVNMNNGGRGARFGELFGYNRNGVTIDRYSNANITWELAKKANLGLEIGLFDNLEVQLDYFTERRTNILMSRSYIPATMGTSAKIQANVGEASAKGLDASIDWNKRWGNGMWLTARGNFTYATSKMEVTEEPAYPEPYRSKVGYSLGQTWGYVAERLFIDQQDIDNSPRQMFSKPPMAGDIKYKDINGDMVINEADKVPIGNSRSPEIVYGFGFSFGYKNFDVSCFFQGLANESFFIDPNKIAPFIYNKDAFSSDELKNKKGNHQVLKVIADDYWSESNPKTDAFWPRLSSESVPNNAQTSTWWMQDGSFLRLKSLEMGYTLPKKFTRKIKCSRLRFYVSGLNLAVWSKFKLWDPEMASNGLGYPVQRVLNTGIQINF
ncbi:TonB-dependent receptor [Prolixibacteraceae bacterium JC049]|nr:TonB-dependent receptor [Prolixibacteraceae bacterium JC049]